MYTGKYKVKLIPWEGLYQTKSRAISSLGTTDLDDVYLININSEEVILERADGAKIQIPTALLALLVPTEKMEEKEEEVPAAKPKKYKVVEDNDGSNNPT